jgi:hypothetical protein
MMDAHHKADRYENVGDIYAAYMASKHAKRDVIRKVLAEAKGMGLFSSQK